jgi:hypothetical protein
MSYLYGYGDTRLTRSELMARSTVSRLHPEFRRRMLAMMDAAAAVGVDLGVGTGWRVQPPAKPGFAQPGNSNHEGFPAGPESTGAVAADMVPAAGWPWMEKNAARFGLRTFRNVNSEPWHIQPAEIPASRNWRTKPWKLDTFPLPAPPAHTPPPTATPSEEDDMWFLSKWHDGSWWQINARKTERYPIESAVALQMVATGAPHVDLPPDELPAIPIPTG